MAVCREGAVKTMTVEDIDVGELVLCEWVAL